MYCNTYFDVLTSCNNSGVADGQLQLLAGFLRHVSVGCRLDKGALAGRPPTFILTLIWLLARTRNRRGPVEPDAVGRLIYSVYRDSDNRTHIISHFPELAERPTVLLLDPPAYDRDENGGRGQTADIGGRSDRL